MRWNAFSPSLVFAAVAALGAVPFLLVASPVLGTPLAGKTVLAATVAVYVAGMAPKLARGVRVGVLAALLGVPIVMVAGNIAQAAIALTVVLAVCRSLFIFRGAIARSLAIEIGLGAASLAAAWAVAGHTTLSLAGALWAYFLVQSTFFLIGSEREVRAPEPTTDPFEAAAKNASELMDRI
jgi:hypothetical protein